MPALIHPSSSREKSGMIGRNDRVVSSGPELFAKVSEGDYMGYKILRSSFSFSDHHETNTTAPCSVVSNKNGFAHTIIRAWQQDLHLRLRPDDVWLAILAQFSFFVDGNAEAVSPIFIAHKEKIPLVIDARPATVQTMDVNSIAQQLASMVKENLKDPSIATTLLPNFTTTTPHDRATASMVFLGTMKEYFDYGIRLGCSFPSVTLLGEKSDWADMLQRVGWFGTIKHGDAISWALRLKKVLEYMVASFDRPDDEEIRRFWRSAVHEHGEAMSGTVETLSGWLTAFCYWGADGKRVYNFSDQELASFTGVEGLPGYKRFTVDGVAFPVIRRDKVPPGVVRVPVTLYGDIAETVTLLAGSIGMQVVKEDDETAVQPASGWWVFSAKHSRFTSSKKSLHA
ncbi:hypothetical protein QBC40DRAFT_275659 [Triangularia verruculosa]|uniref:Uncharacterized protein n=1 Tax=Triangularia verruculosa TaxID=2587418 RepID=A0AAN6XQK0_9PEZI|nr:hypothetical protein QBC40DRAFT_275659 [Triangularia verruculosa]